MTDAKYNLAENILVTACLFFVALLAAGVTWVWGH